MNFGDMNEGDMPNALSMGPGSCLLGDEEISDDSSPESGFDASEFLQVTIEDEVTAQLAAAGPVGIAAAAAIASGKKKGHLYHFETNPARRKRQQTRLIRKLKSMLEEYTTRVGQQAVILCCTPAKTPQSGSAYKVFGSQPLESVVRNCRETIVHQLETSLQERAPANCASLAHLHELPPLVIDGIPTPVDKMTQAQLRNFIPEMLKYSTGRSKPGWGQQVFRPIWWPSDLPWANVRSDARSDHEKKSVSWTEALRTIVKNCYKHHGRDDLLHVFSSEEGSMMSCHDVVSTAHYPSTMVQTINNPDGTVSLIHIETGLGLNSIVTLADGRQATMVHAVNAQSFSASHEQHEASLAVQTLAEVASGQHEVGEFVSELAPVSVEMTEADASLATISGATINQNGQLVLTGDGRQLGGIVPLSAAVYQSISSSLVEQGHIHVTMAPLDSLKIEPDSDEMDTVS